MPTGLRGDRAATTTEYALLLVALAALVSAAFGPGAAELARVARRAWCTLGAATCEDRPPLAAGTLVDPWDSPDPLRRATWGAVAVLGDSFASGEGNGHYGVAGSDERCHASTSAHGAGVAYLLDLSERTHVAACSGARLRDLSHRRHRHPPQLEALDDGTSLVTLTIGGNDLDWAREITACIAVEVLPAGSGCREGDARDRALDARIVALRDDLAAAYRSVREHAPHARIVVTSYPRFFPATPTDAYRQGLATVLDVATQEWVNAQTRLLDDTIREATAEAGVEYVDAYDAFDGHELTTDDPWYHGVEYRLATRFTEPGSFHPNVAGQEALARRVEAAVRHPVR